MEIEKWLLGKLQERETARRRNSFAELSEIAGRIDGSVPIYKLIPHTHTNDRNLNDPVTQWRIKIFSMDRDKMDFVDRTLTGAWLKVFNLTVLSLRTLPIDAIREWKNVGKKGARFVKDMFPDSPPREPFSQD